MTTVDAPQEMMRLAASARCRSCDATLAVCRELWNARPNELDPPFGCCSACDHPITAGALRGLAQRIDATVVDIGDHDNPYVVEIPDPAVERGIYDYLNQGEFWVPKSGDPVRITDMEPEWRYNCARFLLRRARWYAGQYGSGLLATGLGPLGPSGDHACDAFDQMIDEHDHQAATDPQGWMRGTRLYRALVAGLPGSPRRQWRLYQRARHWSTCPARRSNSATCTCSPGAETRQALPQRGLPAPVLVAPLPHRRPPRHRVVWFNTETGTPEPAPCRCGIGVDHNGAGQPVGRL